MLECLRVTCGGFHSATTELSRHKINHVYDRGPFLKSSGRLGRPLSLSLE